MGVISDTVAADDAATLAAGAAGAEPGKATLIDMLAAGRDKYAAALPAWLSIETFMRDANTLLQNDLVRLHGVQDDREDREEQGEEGEPVYRSEISLFECKPRTVLAAFMTAAQLGLRPGVNGECWLQTKYSRKLRGWAASFQVGYQGLIKLAMLSGAVRRIEAVEVFAEDDFHEQKGTEPKIHHVCARMQNPGEVERFYAVAVLANGEPIFTRSWSVERMEAFRAAYAPNKRGAWWTNAHTFVQMSIKTMLKQLAKRLPVTGEFAEAVAADDRVRMDDDPADLPSTVSVYEPDADPEPAPGRGEESQEPVVEGSDGARPDEVESLAPGETPHKGDGSPGAAEA